MLVILSPAKKLHETPKVPAGVTTVPPPLLAQAEALMETVRPLDAAGLKSLMGISDALAELNHGRFQRWQTPFTDTNASPALLTFAGDVYVGLDAASLSAESLAWAQERVVVLSGLYGVLRPLDRMQPYRLEMGTKLATPRGKNLYAFWRECIAPQLAEQLAAVGGDPVIVNVASKEYFKAIDVEAVGARVVTPVFQDVRDGKARTLFLFAKRARGAMARWIIDRRVRSVDRLREFDGMGYRFDAEASDGDRWVFRRPQPPPVR